MTRAEVRLDHDGLQLYIDDQRVQMPRRIEWRGLTVIAQIDAAIKKASGRDVFHISVGGQGRKPTDSEVQEAIDEWVPRGLKLIEKSGVINPNVRHFFDSEALS